MLADLRVPVDRASVEVLTTDGSRHTLIVFHAPGQGLESFVEASEPFFPADEGGAFRLFARHNIVVLSTGLRPTRARGEDEVPETRRAVRVHLQGGQVLEGELRYIAWEANARPLDQLNDGARSFALFTADQIHHVVKAFVIFVEEVKSS